MATQYGQYGTVFSRDPEASLVEGRFSLSLEAYASGAYLLK